jgi:hypothetical protein
VSGGPTGGWCPPRPCSFGSTVTGEFAFPG